MEGSRAIARSERRIKAPHPGLSIASDYLEPLGLDARSFAELIGVDGNRLQAMLAGDRPIDVDAAVRFGRSLGISPERVMRAQLRHDFERSRACEHEMPLPPADTLADRPFAHDAEHGYLARVNGVEAHENLYFVRGEDTELLGPDLTRVHRIAIGDRLRVYGYDGDCIWAGPLLKNLDGTPLFAFSHHAQWERWFVDGLRADWSPGAATNS